MIVVAAPTALPVRNRMTPQSELEIKGNFLTHPFAELLAEISQARVSGSLSVSDKERKCVVYVKEGRVVFAVSNARSSRLFDILLRRGKLTKTDLSQIPNFSNDFEFAVFLEEKQFLSKADCEQLYLEQIEGIIIDILAWHHGDWSFSSLKRIRDGLAYEVDSKRLLFDYGRCLVTEMVLGRFRSLNDRFERSDAPPPGLDLKPDEAFVLSRVGEDPLTVADLASVAAMTEAKCLHSIYTLWLGGLIVRLDWQPAFSEFVIAAMRGAKLELKQEAKIHTILSHAVPVAEPTPTSEPEAEPVAVLTLEEYLQQVESAKTYYDILGIEPKTNGADLKRAYFALAKMFHPDRFHSEGGEILSRIQDAFTELAQAHETLKNPESREVYDYKIRNELATREKHEAAGVRGSDETGGNAGNVSLQSEQAAQNFDRGFSLLMENEHEEALQFLARAVHYAPKNARYHAYYGKALSFDDSQSHKAEGEMQAALKLDPNNPTFRILLAEFFIQVNLLKRAEGELKRLLAIFPSNREAHDLLARLNS